MKHPAFNEEERIIAQAKRLLASSGEVDWPACYQDLTEAYIRLAKTSDKLLSVSDLIERRLKRANETIARQSRELEATREDVERIMRHDLKAPLSAILNLPELIELEGAVNDAQRELLGHIARAGESMLRQINLSLDLYKIETGTYDFAPQPVRLDAVAAQAARELQGVASGYSVAVQLDCPELSPVAGNELLCACVVANLMKNAIEASREGATVSVTLRDNTAGQELTVRNSGAVAEEFRGRFFDKYATSGKVYGTGLGTYSARLMARAMGGEVSLDLQTPGVVSLVVRLRRY